MACLSAMRCTAMTQSAQVLIAEEISADEAAEIASEFRSIGMAIDLRIVPPRRSLSDLAWLVLAAVPLQPFFNQLAQDIADDVHERLKSFVTGVLRRSSVTDSPKPVLVLQDTVTGVQVVLEPDLPAESYGQLLSFDLSTIKRGPLHYDVRRRRWRSELDETSGNTTAP